jgi:hypothetical protein
MAGDTSAATAALPADWRAVREAQRQLLAKEDAT